MIAIPLGCIIFILAVWPWPEADGESIPLVEARVQQAYRDAANQAISHSGTVGPLHLARTELALSERLVSEGGEVLHPYDPSRSCEDKESEPVLRHRLQSARQSLAFFPGADAREATERIETAEQLVNRRAFREALAPAYAGWRELTALTITTPAPTLVEARDQARAVVVQLTCRRSEG